MTHDRTIPPSPPTSSQTPASEELALADELEPWPDFTQTEPAAMTHSNVAAGMVITAARVTLEREAVRIVHDGFEGIIIGRYVTREGKRGVVLQQTGTRVVHVYGEKWLSTAVHERPSDPIPPAREASEPCEYLKFKYSAPPECCKCGSCQLVPPEVLRVWQDQIDSARKDREYCATQTGQDVKLINENIRLHAAPTPPPQEPRREALVEECAKIADTVEAEYEEIARERFMRSGEGRAREASLAASEIAERIRARAVLSSGGKLFDKMADDTQRAFNERKALIEALDGLVLVCGRSGNSLEDFEDQAAAFQRETGFMRPGKDMPAASGGDDNRDTRHAKYSAWVQSKIEDARAALNSGGGE